MVMPQYREMAGDLRATARDMSHADNKKILLAAADRYDRLADSDERARTDARSDKVRQLQNDLNKQMMSLSLAERQRRWPDYYARLTRLRSDGDKSEI